MPKKKQGLVIGFDLDGVIIDHTQKKILWAAAYGHNLKPEQTPAEVIEKLLPPDQLDEIKYLLYSHPEKSLEQPLMPGVQGALRLLQLKNIPLYLISRRKSGDLAKELLKIHNLWPRYFNEANTFFVDGKEDKDIKAKELGITHYVDDEYPVLDVLQSVKDRFLFDSCHVWGDLKKYPKIHSWPELIINLNLI